MPTAVGGADAKSVTHALAPRPLQLAMVLRVSASLRGDRLLQEEARFLVSLDAGGESEVLSHSKGRRPWLRTDRIDSLVARLHVEL